MRLLIFLFFGIAYCSKINAQTTSVFKFKSDVLKTERNIRIHLPKSFDASSDRTYPLVLALDGEYLFYTLLGSTEILSMTDVMPETIIVGIDQNFDVGNNFARWFDCSYNYKTGALDSNGMNFKAFIETELLPYLTTNYHVGKFKTLAGHSFTAQYINFFLENSDFKGFIAVSPYIPESFESWIAESIASVNQNHYYFLCTGEHDLSGHLPKILYQDSVIFSQAKNPTFKYMFKNYLDEDHTSLTTRSATDALRHIYRDYSLIWRLGIDSSLMEHPNLVAFLQERYENISQTYDIKLPYREDDLLQIAWILEETKRWVDLRKIGEMTVDLYPESNYGFFMIGKAEEENNQLESALKYYKLGYSKLGDDVSNKADFYKDIERLEKLIKE